MEKNGENIDVMLMYLLRYIVSYLSVSLAGLFTFLYLSNLLGNYYFAWAGIFFFMILPAILYKPIQRLFKQKATFSFYDTYFEVTLFSLNDIPGKKIAYNYLDVNGARVLSAGEKYSRIDLFLVNGNKKKYVFDEKAGFVSTNPKGFAGQIFESINKYKSSLSDTNDLALIPQPSGKIQDIIWLVVGVSSCLVLDVLAWKNTRAVFPVILAITVIALLRFYFLFTKYYGKQIDD